MEWKKIASMEYGKIVFHSIPYHALPFPSNLRWLPKKKKKKKKKKKEVPTSNLSVSYAGLEL